MVREAIDRVKAIFRLRGAYRAVFLPAGLLAPAQQMVLADLRRACCVDRPTAVYDSQGRVDPIATAMNEGARRVWIRITQPLYLDDDTLHNLLEAHEVDRDV